MRKTKEIKKYGIYYSDVEYNSSDMIIDFNRKICVEAWLSKPRKSPEDYIVVNNVKTVYFAILCYLLPFFR
jgi:hypothetical protein